MNNRDTGVRSVRRDGHDLLQLRTDGWDGPTKSKVTPIVCANRRHQDTRQHRRKESISPKNRRVTKEVIKIRVSTGGFPKQRRDRRSI